MSGHDRPRGAVAVVGTGYLGGRCIEAWAGAPTIAISRRRCIEADVSIVLDLDDDERSMGDLPADYSLLYTVPPATDSLDDYRLQRLLEALPNKPQRFVYISTTGVYGNHDGNRVDEQTPVNPTTDRARRRVAAERQVTECCREHAAAAVILRVPGIYGPDRIGIGRLRSGSAYLHEAEAGPGNRFHVDDLVRCCAAALRDDVPAGIYNVGDGDYRSPTWFAGEVARQAGLTAPTTISMAEARATFSARRLSFLEESRQVETRRMRDTLKVELKYPDPAAGITASLSSA